MGSGDDHGVADRRPGTGWLDTEWWPWSPFDPGAGRTDKWRRMHHGERDVPLGAQDPPGDSIIDITPATATA